MQSMNVNIGGAGLKRLTVFCQAVAIENTCFCDEWDSSPKNLTKHVFITKPKGHIIEG